MSSVAPHDACGVITPYQLCASAAGGLVRYWSTCHNQLAKPQSEWNWAPAEGSPEPEVRALNQSQAELLWNLLIKATKLTNVIGVGCKQKCYTFMFNHIAPALAHRGRGKHQSKFSMPTPTPHRSLWERWHESPAYLNPGKERWPEAIHPHCCWLHWTPPHKEQARTCSGKQRHGAVGLHSIVHLNFQYKEEIGI